MLPSCLFCTLGFIYASLMLHLGSSLQLFASRPSRSFRNYSQWLHKRQVRLGQRLCAMAIFACSTNSINVSEFGMFSIIVFINWLKIARNLSQTIRLVARFRNLTK